MRHLPQRIDGSDTQRQAVLNPSAAIPASYTEVPVSSGFFPGVKPDAGNLLEYWRILKRHKLTISLLSITGGVIGYLVTLPQPPIYQARTSLEIVGLNQNFLNAKESSPLNDGGMSSDSLDIQTQAKILQSDSLLDRVTEKVRPKLPDGPKEEDDPAWRQVLNLPARKRTVEQELLYVRQHLKVRASGQTRIIEVTVDSTRAELASIFANTLTNEFIEQNIESRWKTTERTGEWLARQLGDLRARLQQSEDRLQAAARQAGLVFPDAKTSVSEERLRQIQDALSAAQAERIARQSRAEMAASIPLDALPDILNDATLHDYRSKITELNRQIAELRTIYTGDHPKVKRLQAQIAAIETAVQGERDGIVERIRKEYEEALRRENLLESNYAAQRGIVTGEGEKTVQYSILKREVDSSRQLYDAMLQQLKQSALASALHASNVRVLDPAKPPRNPYKPDIPVSASLGLMGGLFLGTALIVAQERGDRTIQDRGETPFFVNVPELGIVPADDPAMRVRIRIAGSKEPSPSEKRIHRLTGLVTWDRKNSRMAESFRATLVSILFSWKSGTQSKLFLVSSAGPQEGKSTVVSNLGVAIAEVNQRVLLIDADLRKPRLHHIFKLKNDKGLSDVLSCPAHQEGGLEYPIHETCVPNLYVLTSGPGTDAATSLLYSSRMTKLLEKLRSQFETIIIDTPPMLELSDARVLGRMVDSVIFVVRAGKTTRDAAIAACQRFAEDGTPILGTILNYWNPKHSPNGYYYGNYGYAGGAYYASRSSEAEG